MKILAIGQVENDNVLPEIEKQTLRCDQVVLIKDEQPAKGIKNRRKRIAQNHQDLRIIVEAEKPDLVWQVEGDSVLPEDTLERLVRRYEGLKDDNFGYISGVQLGRHGVYAIGAWNMTDTGFESIDYKLKGVQSIDASGFYCLLSPADVWLSGECSWNDEPYGPDVVWGLSIKENKYVDMDLQIGHRMDMGNVLDFSNPSVCNVRFYQEDDKWRYKTSQ